MALTNPGIVATDTGAVVVTNDGQALRVTPYGAVPTFPSLIGLSWPVKRSPKQSTLKQQAISGKETRVQLYTYPLLAYELTFDYLGSGSVAGEINEDWQELESFFNLCAGSARPFHFVDINDCARLGQWLGNGDGVTAVFGFRRSQKSVTVPTQDVTDVSNVRVAGTVVSSATYTLLTDPNWGLTYALQFNSGAAPPLGAPVTADFTYAWPCRFDDDTLEFDNFMQNFWELKKCAFTTMKVV